MRLRWLDIDPDRWNHRKDRRVTLARVPDFDSNNAFLATNEIPDIIDRCRAEPGDRSRTAGPERIGVWQHAPAESPTGSTVPTRISQGIGVVEIVSVRTGPHKGLKRNHRSSRQTKVAGFQD